MRHCQALIVIILLGLLATPGQAQLLGLRGDLHRINRSLRGQVLDFTHNHGQDRRIWSEALCEKRALYVYVPPCYDPAKKYPMAIWLHGAGQDEVFFLRSLAREFDRAIVAGELPPMIVVAPDGSILGRPSFFKMATFFANTDAGRYEDYLMQDVWNFVMTNFPIRPERDARLLVGSSMGGAAAFTCAIKHKDRVGVAMGLMPALNLRWVDCHGRYAGPFHPDCAGWREHVKYHEVIGRPRGLPNIRAYHLFSPLIERGPEAIPKLAQFNPVEVMERYNLQPGELQLYISYGGKDEFNIPAQVESFLYIARQRKIDVAVDYDPNGRHDVQTGLRMFPGAIHWAAPLTERFRD
jgi:S-formylglutathione hydrolase FrmB